MKAESELICMCPLEGIIDLISKKWALLIINEIGNHKRLRFHQLMDELREVSPKTLADTLKKLQAAGLIKREGFAEIPPRVEYSLTKDGVELRRNIIPLLQWAGSRTERTKFASCGCVPEGQGLLQIKA